MSQVIVLAPASIDVNNNLTERLRVDADFDARWAAWQSRGRNHDRTLHRRQLMLLPVAAVGIAIVGLLLAR